MDPQSIHFNDWQRLLFGNAPPEFLIEVLIRAIIIYAVLLFVIRLLGKRMSGQLSITEMAVMLTLGAIISVPMQMPERGILHGVVMLFFVLAFQRGFTWFVFKSRKVEDITQGAVSILIKDGILELEELRKLNISREQLFAILRSEEIYHLGQIKRVYQEANGNFSIYKADPVKPGYSILPKMDDRLGTDIQRPADDALLACRHCGNTIRIQSDKSCPVCGDKDWEKAVLAK
ncbi:YetF domain-containing protein [Chitinophaga pinensis]|uniref:DUF421 domain-containing protein n=1 Tax=Chitinophaga pinensis TaxID=79329 RepID=A0A5C6LNJ1_9BACT|nr:YetF domain-containing protein [Chitinophaga pinensis]TWV98732.1 DUF421 domain-containing protein [Chitinophaga pinensis]